MSITSVCVLLCVCVCGTIYGESASLRVFNVDVLHTLQLHNINAMAFCSMEWLVPEHISHILPPPRISACVHAATIWNCQINFQAIFSIKRKTVKEISGSGSKRTKTMTKWKYQFKRTLLIFRIEIIIFFYRCHHARSLILTFFFCFALNR